MNTSKSSIPKTSDSFTSPIPLLNYGMQLQMKLPAFYIIPLQWEKETNLWTTLRSITVFANPDLYEFKADCGYLRGLTENKSVIRFKTQKTRDFHVFLWSNSAITYIYKSVSWTTFTCLILPMENCWNFISTLNNLTLDVFHCSLLIKSVIRLNSFTCNDYN